ncbi:polymerase [Kamese virus]|uniref:Replicase n=2 Tax=Kamese virus TaxID=200402 RepID=A0A0D3R153_9RHAB|nr:polymerase [Kamese virus]AJR28326.1 polymerase [Kamese virus]
MEDENEDFDQLQSEYELSHELDGELDVEWLEGIDSMEFLNQFDYNLNSPVINDHLEELEKYLRNREYNPVFSKATWHFTKQAFNKHGYVHTKEDPDEWKYHRFCISYLRRGYKPGQASLFRSYLSSCISNARETGIVLQVFLKAWAKRTVDLNRIYDVNILNDIPNEVWYWGDLFLSIHLIILHMNCTGPREALQLNSTFKSSGVDGVEDKTSFQFTSNMFGRLVISGGYAFLKDHSIILDRNMLLMLKDICVSRVQVILSILYPEGDLYKKHQSAKKLIDLYLIGDSHLLEMGNIGYDGLKLIEPICNLRLCQLARNYRPLIPEFPEFQNHVYRSVAEKQGNSPYLSAFLNAIVNEDDVTQVLIYYSVFRHWGHPDIDYMEGLEKLHTQVTMDKIIDDDYAQALASDLAYKILKKKFFEKKKWFVDIDKVDEKNLLYHHIKSNTWPNQYQIQEFGDNWHTLPITKIYDLPDVLDPSLIYSDKSHSMNRSEVLDWVRNNPNSPIPTKRVLQSLLEKPETNWVKFLQKINDEGLDLDSLIIGLRAKEREMKRIGRFFSLMSWELREYFVYTEYLIKEFFVPLFKGLTMADDLQEVVKKMLENVSGQGLDTYEFISIANHIDYEKWNNHQRYESNCYIFKVMGMCFGLPNLFLRSHEFFEKSLIYYNQRPDLMVCRENTMNPSTMNCHVCWDGQKGGLEGLRQKGWSIVNLLVIERESKIRNTLVKVLAQGDNQTISTCYELIPTYDEEELLHEIEKIVHNNNSVMNAIRSGTNKLGLLINEDETMVSADYLNYGKVPIFRGIIRGLDAKRWSRVNFGNNDQVPSLGSLLSSVATNALTVSHFSETPVTAMILHNLFANLTIELLKIYNPAVRSPLMEKVRDHFWLTTREFRILVIYLDPSLGGIGGTSLTRFLIRMFPDPVTESLSFWKVIASNTEDKKLRDLAITCGHPILEEFNPEHLDKLIENPVALNISRGISAVNLLKNQVRTNLINNRSKIQNSIIRLSLDYVHQEEITLYAWARSIRPLFPRFISEMVNSTYYGITNSIVSMFQNSRTIRNQYKSRYARRIDDVICVSELIGIANIIKVCRRANFEDKELWTCSSSLADELRLKSWNERVLGTTIPHPLEMLGSADNLTNQCGGCLTSSSYLSVLVPKGLHMTNKVKGPYPPYLGSRTSETTSLIQPWDKDTNIPLLRRAVKMRNSISWFVDPDSRLASSILNNLESLTGEDWSSHQIGFKRTGSALHRFTCARQSNGGFSASAPTNLTWMICTTDTMENLNDKNYDFMFQSLIIYAQATTSVIWGGKEDCVNVHYHINCPDCLREIEEPWLESEWELVLPDVHNLLGSWRPDPDAAWGTSKVNLELPDSDWESVPQTMKSRQVGHVMGFLYTDMLLSHSKHVEDSSLFPLGIRGKMHPQEFFEGLFLGVQRACALQLIHRRNLLELKKPRIAQWGLSFYVLESLCESIGFLNFVRDGPLHEWIMMSPHKLPSSYPLNNRDLGSIGRSYLKNLLVQWFNGGLRLNFNMPAWLFADLQSHDIIGSISISIQALKLVMTTRQNQKFKETIRRIQEIYINVKNEQWDLINVPELVNNILVCSQELRHAVKFHMESPPKAIKGLNWGKEWTGSVIKYPVLYDSLEKVHDQLTVPRRGHPIISGLRLNQFATGAHYKIRTIISELKIHWTGAICGGDGSGGISAYLCRSNPNGRVLFNSLLMMDGINFKGSHPSPPAAIMALRGDRTRCINLEDVWKHPSDLSKANTWAYFLQTGRLQKIKWDLIVLDMEVTEMDIMEQIEKNVATWGLQLLEPKGTIIFKTYVNRVLNYNSIIDKIGPQFSEVLLCQTNISSSYTSEIYAVFKCLEINTVPKLFPDKQDLFHSLQRTHCFQNHNNELKRAREIHAADLLSGVPQEVLPDIIVDLGTILTILGLESGYAVSIAKSWQRHKGKNHINYLLAVCLLCCESNYQTTHKIKGSLSVPSNPQLLNMLTVINSVWAWIALKTNAINLYSQTYEMLNNIVRVNFGRYLKRDKIFQNWNLSGQGEKSKTIRLSHRSSQIAQLIRLYQRMFKDDPVVPQNTNIQTILKFYNEGLKPTRLMKSTGLFEFLMYV